MTIAALSLEHAKAFVERYTREFDQSNWPTFAFLFNEPAVSVRGDGTVKLLSSYSEALAFFRGVSERDLYIMLLLFAFLVFKPGGLFPSPTGRE